MNSINKKEICLSFSENIQNFTGMLFTLPQQTFLLLGECPPEVKNGVIPACSPRNSRVIHALLSDIHALFTRFSRVISA